MAAISAENSEAPRKEDIARTFKELELPDSPKHSVKKHALTEVRGVLLAFLKNAAAGVLKTGVEALPFGIIAVSLVEEMVEHVATVRKNQQAAILLGEEAKLIIAKGSDFVVYFDQHHDKTGMKLADDLLQLSFLAMRLVFELRESQGLKKKILIFIGCKKTKEALEQLRRDLLDTRGAVNWIATSREITSGSSEEEANLDILRDRPAGEEAVKLWRDRGWREEAPLDRLLDILGDIAEKRCVALPAGASQLDQVPLVYSYFADKTNNEIVAITRFAKFLGQSATIADALKVLLAAVATPPPTVTGVQVVSQADDATTSDTLIQPAPVPPPSIPSPHRSSMHLRRLLAPVSAGEDLARHLAVFQPGTREWVFRDVEAWAALPLDSPNRRVFWLRGTGGLGKSVIAAQLVARYGRKEEGESDEDGTFGQSQEVAPINLVAYFFCKHDDEARNDPRRVVATLTFRLASMLPTMHANLETILADDAQRAEVESLLSGSKGGLVDLYNRILAEPLQDALQTMGAVEASAGAHSADIFVLVDALDEMQTGDSRQELLDLIGLEMPRLPERVRFIFTSRPEKDIVTRFDRLRPYTIDRQNEKQLADLRLYAQAHLVQQTGLRHAPQAEVECVVAEALEKADGVFLALRLVASAIKSIESELDGKRQLGVQDVLELFRTRGNLVDDAYTGTLQRVQARLREAAGGDAKMENELTQTLTQILATLLAARCPLLRSEVATLFGGLHRRSETLTEQLLSAVSLLYSANSPTSPIEPLHKTVVDFLRDPKRSKEHWVDERDGHTALALATFRVLREHGLLPDVEAEDSKPRVVQPEEVESLSVVQYVLRHGHVHLSLCVAEAAKAAMPHSCSAAALHHWQQELLAPRETVDPGKRDKRPKNYIPSSHAATTTCGAWLLLVAYTANSSRATLRDLLKLDAALSCSAPKEVAMLTQLMREILLGYSFRWVPQEALFNSVAMFLSDMPGSGLVHASSCAKYLIVAVGCSPPPVLRIPALSTAGSCLQVLPEHGSWVTSVAYSPDGSQIVTACSDTVVRVCDAITGEVLLQGLHNDVTFRQMTSADGAVATVRDDEAESATAAATADDEDDDDVPDIEEFDYSSQDTLSSAKQQFYFFVSVVTAVAHSPDGQRIVSGSKNDQTVRVRDAQTGKVVLTLQGHVLGVNAVAYSSSGLWIVSGSEDKTVRVWDAHTGEALRVFEGHNAAVTSVGFNPNGSWIVSGSSDSTLRVWNAHTGAVVHCLLGHKGLITCVRYSPDGAWIVSSSSDKTARVWNAHTGETHHLLKGHTSLIGAVGYSPDGKQIVSGSSDGTVCVWDAQTGSALHSFQGHNDSIVAVGYSPDGKRIVSGGGTVRIWDALVVGAHSTFHGQMDPVECVAFSPNGKHIVSACSVGRVDNMLRIWDAQTGEALLSLHGHKGCVKSVGYSPNGKQIASGSEDATVRVWDSQNGKNLHTLEIGHPSCIFSVAFSPNGKHIASGSDDWTVRVWDIRTSKALQKLVGHEYPVLSVAYSPDGTRIVSACYERLLLWDPLTGHVLHSFQNDNRCLLNFVSYSCDGTKIMSLYESSNTVHVWDSNTCKALCTLHIGESMDGVSSLRGSPDGNCFVSSSRDNTVRVWDAHTGELLHSLVGHSDVVTCVAFSPDGQRIVSGSADKTLRVWDVHAGDASVDAPWVVVEQDVVKTSSVSAIATEGFMFKQGGIRKNWLRRHFILNSNQLTYYDGKGGKLKGTIDLAHATVQDADAKETRPNTFYVVTPGRTYKLSPATVEEKTAWMLSLSRVWAID